MEPKIIGNIKLIDSKIVCKGSGNIIYIDNTDGPLIVKDTIIQFNGDNGLLFAYGNSKKSLKMKVTINNSCVLHIGKNAAFNKKADLHLACSERKHIFIGDDVLFSNDIWFRTSDAHPIYSTKTKERISLPKSIIVGDHVWIGQGTLILKGTIVGSGSIIGANSVVSGKTLLSNTSYGGAPCRIISEEGAVFFDKVDLNAAKKDESQKFELLDKEGFIYDTKKSNKVWLQLKDFLDEEHSVTEYIDYFKNLSKDKNRFAIGSKDVPNKK